MIAMSFTAVIIPRFPLGQIVTTPGAQAAFEKHGIDPLEFLARHAQCDWGTLDPEDHESNDIAFRKGGRLMSVYYLKAETAVWIITEHDRSVTTFLTPDEY